jgi:HEAT repeat protein
MAEKRVEDLVRPLKDVIEALTEALSHSRPSVRSWAARTLGQWFPEAYAAVSVFRGVPNKKLAAEADIDELWTRVCDIPRALEDRLQDAAADVREVVAAALARIRNG